MLEPTTLPSLPHISDIHIAIALKLIDKNSYKPIPLNNGIASTTLNELEIVLLLKR